MRASRGRSGALQRLRLSAPRPPAGRSGTGSVAALRGTLARWGTRLTPFRVVGGVAALAALALAVSQFLDYRGVAVGTSDYSAYPGLEAVAPAPQVDHESTGSAHAWVLLPLALAAAVCVVLALAGRWRLGRIAALIGLFALVVAVVVDAPAGLDEGATAVAYAGARAELIEGYWVEVASAVVLATCGLLLAAYGRRLTAEAPGRRRRQRPAAGAPRLGAGGLREGPA